MRPIHRALALTLMLAPAWAARAPSAFAQEEQQPACADRAAPVAGPYAAWTAKKAAASAARAADLPKAELIPGQAVLAALHPTREIGFMVQPEKPGGSVSKGGMFSLRIDTPGVYRFALGAGPWVDVLKDEVVVQSIAHGPGPACSGIRKTVDFPLEAGVYVLQISASPDDTLALLVLRQP
jgi:hypothetical protein